jgi:predicted Zn-dependent protease
MTASSRKEQIEAMLAEDPGDPFLRYALAMEYLGESNDEEALRQFRQLLAASPDYVAGYQQAGQLLIRRGELNEARSVLDRGVAEALKQGNQHAAEEMRGLLGTLS